MHLFIYLLLLSLVIVTFLEHGQEDAIGKILIWYTVQTVFANLCVFGVTRILPFVTQCLLAAEQFERGIHLQTTLDNLLVLLLVQGACAVDNAFNLWKCRHGMAQNLDLQSSQFVESMIVLCIVGDADAVLYAAARATGIH